MLNTNPNEIYVHVNSSSSASLLRSQTGGNCDFDIGDDWNRFKTDNGESVLSFDLPSCIDTSDNTDSVKQNGDQVEFSFYTTIFRILTNTTSVEMEPSQQMSCSVSSSFETEDEATINNASVASLNATFELSPQDISLFVTTMNALDNEAQAMLARDSSYSLVASSLSPSNLLVGEKVLIYVHPDQFNVFNNFWFSLEKCKVCKNSDCTGDSLDIIQNACTDSTQLSTFMSTPLSTSTVTNEYINSINSEFNYQLAEMTLFQFSNSDKLTISCDIGLSPKQTIDQYKLSSLYGQCSNPSRTASRKRRSEPDTDETMSKITISNTINISKKNKKTNSSLGYSISVPLTVIMFFLF